MRFADLDRSTVAGQVRYLAYNPHYFTQVSGREYSEEAITEYIQEFLPHLSIGGKAKTPTHYCTSSAVRERARLRREERIAGNERMTKRRMLNEELVALQRSINQLW